MAEKIAKFRFLGYKITDSQIHIDAGSTVSKGCDVTFEKTAGVNDTENKMRLLLVAKIDSHNKAMHIEVNAEGYFEFEQDITDEEKKIFFNTSAPAILFPYVRAYIGSLTALSGVAPVVLPTLNLSDR
jgi:preprotein translocase subunit SecB